MKIVAIVETLTGNTMSFIEYIEESYGDKVSIDIFDPFTFNSPNFDDYDKVLLGCYTWDLGKIPIEMKEFIIDYREDLLEEDILLFGSGWSVYSTFCRAVDSMNTILDNKFPKAKFELRFDKDLEPEAIEILDRFIKSKDN